MLGSRHGYRSSLDLAVGSDELFDRTEGAATEVAGGSVSPRQVRIHHPNQAKRFALLRQLVIDAGVIATESAYSNHGDVNEFVRRRRHWNFFNKAICPAW
jgi:hypothetical protein